MFDLRGCNEGSSADRDGEVRLDSHKPGQFSWGGDFQRAPEVLEWCLTPGRMLDDHVRLAEIGDRGVQQASCRQLGRLPSGDRYLGGPRTSRRKPRHGDHEEHP
jgi:hypothetical protein